MKFRPGFVPTLVMLVFVALLLLLGLWQLSREQQKQQQEVEYVRGSKQTVVKIDSTVSSLENFLYRPVTVRGTYDQERQFLLDNRTYKGVEGYFVLTPLMLTENRGILVNRGWIPSGATRDDLPDLSIGTASGRVKGHVARAPRVFLLGVDGYQNKAWPLVVQSVDYDAMSRHLSVSLLPGIVNLDNSEPNGYVRDWLPFVGISPQKHRAYAVQWFSMALVLIILYVFFGFSRRIMDKK